MPPEDFFDPEKTTLVNVQVVTTQVTAPELFDTEKIKGYHTQNAIELSFNIDNKQVKSDISITVTSESNGTNTNEASGHFQLTFFFYIDNLIHLLSRDKKGKTIMDDALMNALTAITYSTTRGILLTRLQGTALQSYIMPVIDPNNLIVKS
jgi:hypothetical protein